MAQTNTFALTEIERLSETYRKLLLDFTILLRDKKREGSFKLYSGVPGKYWGRDIEDTMKALEHEGVLSINRLEMLRSFMESYGDSKQMAFDIREFEYRIKLVQMLSDYSGRKGEQT